MSAPPKPAPRPQPAARPGSTSPANQVKQPPPPVKFAKDKREGETQPLPSTPPPTSPTLKPNSVPKLTAGRSKSSHEVYIQTTDENNVTQSASTVPPRPASGHRSGGTSPLVSPSPSPNQVARPKLKGKGAPPPPPKGSHKQTTSVGSDADIHAAVTPTGRKPPPPVHRKQNSNVSITSDDRPNIPQKPAMPKRPITPKTSKAALNGTPDTPNTPDDEMEEAPPRSVKDKANFLQRLQRQMSNPNNKNPTSSNSVGKKPGSPGLSPKPSQTSKFTYSDPQRDARMAMAAAMTGRTMEDMLGFEKKREVQPVESEEEEAGDDAEVPDNGTDDDTAETAETGPAAAAAAGEEEADDDSSDNEEETNEVERTPTETQSQPPARPAEAPRSAGRPKSVVLALDATDTEAPAEPSANTATSSTTSPEDSLPSSTEHTVPVGDSASQGTESETPADSTAHVDLYEEKDVIATHPGHERAPPHAQAQAEDNSDASLQTPVPDILMYQSELKLHRCLAREKLGLELFDMLKLSGETDNNKSATKQFATLKTKLAKCHKSHSDKFTKTKKTWTTQYHKTEASLTHKGMLSRMSHAKDVSHADVKAQQAMEKDSELCSEFDAMRQNAHLAVFSDEGAYYRELESIEEKAITDMSQDESKALVKKQKSEMDHLSKAAKKGKDANAQQALLEAKQRQDDEREALSATQNDRRTKVHAHHQVLQRKAKERANQIVEDVGKGIA